MSDSELDTFLKSTGLIIISEITLFVRKLINEISYYL